jgi:GNAT superfamily N-acetyltransferase
MLTASERLTAANLNCVAAYCKLASHSPAGEVRQFGKATTFTTGVSISLFNGCFALQDVPAGDTEAALDWLAERHLRHRLWTQDGTPDSAIVDVARRHGLAPQPWAMPGMVLSVPSNPTPPPDGVTVDRVQVGQLDGWLAVIAGELPRDLAELLFRPSLVEDPDVALFIASHDGVPSGTSTAIRTGDVAGVYAVITVQAARRRGVGTAASWAAVDAGRAWGCDLVTLQASEMGLPIYTQMGFETVVHYETFGPLNGG